MEAFIELIQEEEKEKYESSYVPPSQENPAGPRAKSSPPPTASDIPPAISESLPMLPKESASSSHNETVNLTADNSSYETPWICPMCTLENPSTFLCCDVCAAEQPPPTNTLSTSTSGQGSTQPVRLESRNSKKRPLSFDRKEEKQPNPGDRFVFKNRTRPLDTLKSLDRGVDKKPLGWVCISCSSFMETQWWTCSCCGTMKPSS
jgi:hypothetical protein